MQKVFVTQKEYDKAAEVYAECTGFQLVPAPSEENALAATVAEHAACAVVVGVDAYAGSLYDALASANGRSLIARFGVGHDGIDKSAARRAGIFITNTPGVLDKSVAEHTFWLLGALARNVASGDAAMRRGDFPSRQGTELAGKTLLVIGLGAIGQQVAGIAGRGFGMNVIAVGQVPLADLAARYGVDAASFLRNNGIASYTTDVDSALTEADVVSLHLASNEQTRHFLSATRLARMKAAALLVNTSRGPVIDEHALFSVLRDRKIAGAALDVFEVEPYRPAAVDADLRTLDNVVLTPHLGSSTAEANRRMGEATLRNVRLFFAGRYEEMNLVDRSLLEIPVTPEK